MNTTLKNTKRGGAIALAILALCFIAFAPNARAGAQSQTDTNVLAAASTNTFILNGDITGTYTNGQTPGGQALLNCQNASHIWIECGGFFTNSGAGSSNITFRIAGSVTGTQWTNNYASVVVSVPVGTNYASGTLLIQNSMPVLGLRAIENVNTGNVSARGGTGYIKTFTKTGL